MPLSLPALQLTFIHSFLSVLLGLHQNYKKIRSKHIQNPFITPCPAEVTGLVGQSNMLEFSNQKNISGVAVVQLIQEITAEEVPWLACCPCSLHRAGQLLTLFSFTSDYTLDREVITRVQEAGVDRRC